MSVRPCGKLRNGRRTPTNPQVSIIEAVPLCPAARISLNLISISDLQFVPHTFPAAMAAKMRAVICPKAPIPPSGEPAQDL
jgi:hypothetical protein